MDWKQIDILQNEYLTEVIQPSFPFIKYIGNSSWSQQGESKPNLSFNIPQQNLSLNDSDYYYQETNRFIHYTSLEGAVNIFNDGFFKLNSLTYLDDPQEMYFALKNSQELKHLKQNIFCLSFCKYDEIQNPDSFDSWRLYGRDGGGIGIVFKFIPSLDSWTDNYLSEIHYGKQNTNFDGYDETTEKFELFKKNQQEFILKYQDSIEFLPHPFNKNRELPDWLAIFLAFHKSSLYKIENEVRYLKWVDKLPNSFTLNRQLEMSSYEKLFITNRTIAEKQKSEIEFGKDPSVEIDKIIVGYRLPDKLKETLRNGLNQIRCYLPKVVESPISEAFH